MKTVDWNELAKEVHQNAVNKGFWDVEKSDKHCLMLVITEISEAVEADRKGIRANLKEYKKFLKEKGIDFTQRGFKVEIKDSVEDELADVVIRLLDLAGARGFDLSMVQKLDEIFDCDMSKMTFTEAAFEFCSVLSNYSDGDIICICVTIHYVSKWCEKLGIDLAWHIEQKMKYNENRLYLHGKIY